ncbi:MAG: hypothetical protein Q4G50_11670, partial [Corynebacterium sp.]|uniref:hypothetical protein n=1 Tax=Corynebacterium sp. TaxID=1720 RepID=UPI0026DFB36B
RVLSIRQNTATGRTSLTFGSRVGAGARGFSQQAKEKFDQTRERIDTPENRARLAQSRKQARSSLGTLPLPASVYGVVAVFILIMAWFPWFSMSMTHRAAINMGFWGASVGESALSGAFNGFGIGAVVGGMRATGSRDSYTEETMVHGLLLAATLLAIGALVAAALMVWRYNKKVGNIVAVAAGAVYGIYLMSLLDGRIWQGAINAADAEAGRRSNPLAQLSSSANTADSPVVYLVILAAIVVVSIGVWQLLQARKAQTKPVSRTLG